MTAVGLAGLEPATSCSQRTLAAKLRCPRLIVTHLAPTLDPQVSVHEAAARFDGPVDHAVPGMEVEL